MLAGAGVGETVVGEPVAGAEYVRAPKDARLPDVNAVGASGDGDNKGDVPTAAARVCAVVGAGDAVAPDDDDPGLTVGANLAAVSAAPAATIVCSRVIPGAA